MVVVLRPPSSHDFVIAMRTALFKKKTPCQMKKDRHRTDTKTMEHGKKKGTEPDT